VRRRRLEVELELDRGRRGNHDEHERLGQGHDHGRLDGPGAAVVPGRPERVQDEVPKVKVTYQATGDNTPTVLATAVQGGNPPDLASVSQPGLVKDFATKGSLKPLTFAKSTIAANYSPDFIKLTTYNGKLYGLIFKGPTSRRSGTTSTRSRTRGQAAEDVAGASHGGEDDQGVGHPAYSIGGADGWTLTDLFENVYLRQAGAAKYDQLTTHKIPWTDPSVKTALKTMATSSATPATLPAGPRRAADRLPDLGQRTSSRARRRPRW
jgi:hypothetical protein